MVVKFKECSGTERYKASPSEFTIRFNDVPKYRHSFSVDHKKHTRIIITHQASSTKNEKLLETLFVLVHTNFFFVSPILLLEHRNHTKCAQSIRKKNIPNLFSPKHQKHTTK